MDAVEHEEEPTRWRYTGGVERLYMDVPVTVQDGAVIEHVGIPAEDGCWEPAEDDDEVTHVPDNAAREAELLGDVDADDDLGDTDREQQQVTLNNEPAGE